MISLIKNISKTGFLNFKRGGLVSFASILVLVITLSVVVFLLLLQVILNFSLKEIQNKVDVSIYFVNNAPEEKILVLKNSIEKLPEVESVSYVSAVESLKNFREKHKNDYITIQALDEIKDNPFGGYLNIKAKDISQYENIANFLKSDDALVTGSLNIIDKINYYQNKDVIDRLNLIINNAKRLGFILTLVLIIISIIVTYNTVRLTIFISKDEIGIMRLVGSSKMRIRGPFIVEGVIYGLIASILTLIIFFPITSWFGKNMTQFLNLNLGDYYLNNIFEIFGILLVVGILLGVVSSLLAIRKYLNK